MTRAVGRTRHVDLSRPWMGGRERSAWVALVVGAVLLVVIGVGVLTPVFGLVAAGVGAAGGFVHVPAGRIVVVPVLGFVVAAALLLTSVRTRSGVVAWIAVAASTVVALCVSVYPLFALAFAAVDDVRDVVPWIRSFLAHLGR